jgi:cytochrome c oxidase subunit 2
VVALVALAHWGGAEVRRHLASRPFVIIGGAVFPAITLAALLVHGLALTGVRAADKIVVPGTLGIEVTGEQWWWRVTYSAQGDGAAIATANEIRIPVGRPVAITLGAADVIHSFWVPNLGGKVDTIPGVINRMHLQATKTGSYRGQCAEYCGGPHAHMALIVIVEDPERFETWLESQRQVAMAPVSELQRQGQSLFQSSGCAGCHTIRGTDAAGTIGPDLTHVGGRMTIGAATLPSNADAFVRWISDNQHIKPGNRMPAFGIFSPDELAALSAYLENLK